MHCAAPAADHAGATRSLCLAAVETAAAAFGVADWDLAARRAGLARRGAECRLNWANESRPSLAPPGEPWSDYEDARLFELTERLGQRQVRAAARRLPPGIYRPAFATWLVLPAVRTLGSSALGGVVCGELPHADGIPALWPQWEEVAREMGGRRTPLACLRRWLERQAQHQAGPLAQVATGALPGGGYSLGMTEQQLARLLTAVQRHGKRWKVPGGLWRVAGMQLEAVGGSVEGSWRAAGVQLRAIQGSAACGGAH